MIYKTLDGATGAYGHGDYTGYLPHGKRPGKWLPKTKPVLCESGYHGCRDLTEVLDHFGPDLYEIEARGACDSGDDKAAWEQIRLLRRVPEWSEHNLRLFAVDCVRLAVNRYAQKDQRELLHACLDVSVAYLEGFSDATAYYAAARAAAYGAADAAARADQAALLARYLAGEQGPFVEEEAT